MVTSRGVEASVTQSCAISVVVADARAHAIIGRVGHVVDARSRAHLEI